MSCPLIPGWYFYALLINLRLKRPYVFNEVAMTKNLEMADNIVKVVLAVLTIVLFFFNVIAGPLATVLVILSCAMLVIYAIRLFIQKGSFRKINSGK
ncbi:MAG: hypothetical protein WEB30_04315 [Cyclobacteriaceae bacterium]